MPAPYSILDRFITSTESGETIPFAVLEVKDPSGVLQNLYAKRDGTTSIEFPSGLKPNPITADENGRVIFYINPGRYNLKATSSEGDVFYYDVLVAPEDFLRASQIAGVAPTIDTWASISSVPVSLPGQLFNLAQHTSGGIGGGTLMSFAGSVTEIDGIRKNSATAGFYLKRITDYDVISSDYYKTSDDLSGIIQTHGKKVVITGDSLSYNNYGFGFAYAASGQEANAGIRSCGFMLRDAIHMSDPCFVYGDNIPWNINNPSYAATAINNTNPFVLPFNNRSMRYVVSNSAAVVTMTIASFNIVNKQVVLHMAHSPGQPGKFDVYYNDNTGGADVFVSNVQVGNGVDHQGYAPFTITIPVNSLDSSVRIILKNFTDVAGAAIVTPMAFFVLAAGSKLTSVYTTGVGGQTADYFVTNYASKIGTYAPDVLITFLGANDRLTKTLAQHLTAMGQIFAAARVSNPAVRIIHITAPPADAAFGNTGYYPDSAISPADTITMREWVSGVEQFCRQQNVMFFNLYRFLYGYPSAEIFVDGIHATRIWGANTFKAIMERFFSKSIAPVDHLSGSSTYSVAGTGDLMGRTIGYIQKTPATVKLRGQFRITYVHGTTSWTFADNQEDGTFKPSAFKSIAVDGSAHTNIIEFYCPVVSTGYNEFPEPLKASAEYLTGSGALITGLSIKPRGNNTLTFTIRDSAGALISPATMDGAQFLIKYWQ